MRLELKHSIKPNGARKLGMDGEAYAVESRQWLVFEGAFENDAMLQLAQEKAEVNAATKIRADLGNVDSAGDLTYVTAAEWKEHVAKWQDRELSPEFLTTKTSKSTSEKAMVEALVAQTMVRKSCTRAEAIAWVKENW